MTSGHPLHLSSWFGSAGFQPAPPAEAPVSRPAEPSRTAWPQLRTELAPALSAQALDQVADVVAFTERRDPQGDSGHAEQVLRVLAYAGVGETEALTAGALLDSVLRRAFPLGEVRDRFGSAPARILLRLAPTSAPSPDAARHQVAGDLLDTPVVVQTVALADWYVATTGSADPGRRQSLLSAIDRYLLPLATRIPPFDELFSVLVKGVTTVPAQPRAGEPGGFPRPLTRRQRDALTFRPRAGTGY